MRDFLLLRHTHKTTGMAEGDVSAGSHEEQPAANSKDYILSELHHLVANVSGLVHPIDQPLMQSGVDSLGMPAYMHRM